MQPTPTTKLALPAPLERYFTRATTDPAGVARCFTDDGVVVDERHQHRGRAAIAAWNAASTAKHSFTTEPLSGSIGDDVFVVRAKVSGTIPGSPVELRFGFTIDGDLIAQLEITP